MKYIIILILIGLSCRLGAQIFTPACDKLPWTVYSWSSIMDCDYFEYGDWVMVFNDEFDGSQLDESKWFWKGGGWNSEHGDELQYYLKNNIVFEDGMVKLTAKREPDYYEVWRFDPPPAHTIQKYFEYTSGWLETKMRFEYGYFEIRCKIPYGKGLWPAFWIFGSGGEDGANEVDIFEFGCDEPEIPYFNIWKYIGDDIYDCSTHKDYDIDFSSNFHTHSLEWDDFKLIYRIDGVIKRIDYKNLQAGTIIGLYDCEHHVPGFYARSPYFPFCSGHVILNLAVSHGPFGGPPDESTVFPAAMEVDYVRIYRRKNPTRDIFIQNFNQYESHVQTCRSACILGDNTILEAGQSFQIYITDNFYTYPGKSLTLELGSSFSVDISE